ncbi:MAG: hypothetical protein MUO23_06310 [Anaerolineales bacterium]|nr:hypothetical protein [Anaerolineales bacterium]
MSILNASHLPGGGAGRLYPTTTPASSFRLILDQYLGGSSALLDNITYFSYETDMHGFEVVPHI